MFNYEKTVKEYEDLKKKNPNIYKNINSVSAARMRLQNRFHTGLDIAQYTADIMHADMADYDKDSSVYTQSLGCWHGFTAQQMMMEIKRSHTTTSKRYVYLSGWMIAALRSEFGPLPDQSMHEKTAVPNLIKEIYTFLKRADSVQLQHLFNELDLFFTLREIKYNTYKGSRNLKDRNKNVTEYLWILSPMYNISEPYEIEPLL